MTIPTTPVALPPTRKFHLGAQNDAWYIISGEPPALNNDYPRHDADRTCVAKVFDEAEARRLVDLANRPSAEQAVREALASLAQPAPAGDERAAEPISYHKNDEGPEAAEAYAKLLARLDESGRKRLVNEVAHGAKATLAVDGAVVLTRKDWGSLKILRASHPTSQAAVAVPEIDYEKLVADAWANHKYAQGSKECIAFKRGAEWYLRIAAAPQPTKEGE